MRLENFIDFLQHLGDPQIRCLGDRSREIAPKPCQHIFIVGFARTDRIQLIFEICGKVIPYVFPEIIGQESRHQPAFVFGDQAVFIFANVFAVLDRCDDRCICRRPSDPKFFHTFDQGRFGVAGRRLGQRA